MNVPGRATVVAALSWVELNAVPETMAAGGAQMITSVPFATTMPTALDVVGRKFVSPP